MGQGFEDIRSPCPTPPCCTRRCSWTSASMLYGRGTTGNGYAGALGHAGPFTAASASVTGSLSAGTYAVVVAADAGDLLGTTGAFHQGTRRPPPAIGHRPGQRVGHRVRRHRRDRRSRVQRVRGVDRSRSVQLLPVGRGSNSYTFTTLPANSSASVAASPQRMLPPSPPTSTGSSPTWPPCGGYVKRLNSTLSTRDAGDRTADAVLIGVRRREGRSGQRPG